MLIKITDIMVNPDHKEASPEAVEKLMDSMGEVGLLCAITVDTEHHLIAGFHRLEAAKRLGWTEIECVEVTLTGIHAKLAEIDENLVRRNIPSLEFGALLLARKKLYEEIHPETQHGGDRRSQDFKCAKCALEKPKSFVDDTAERLHVNPSTVRRELQTAENMTDEARSILQNARIDPPKGDALALSRMDPDQQIDAAQQLARGEIQSVKEYLNQNGEVQGSAPAQNRGQKNQDRGDQKQEKRPREDRSAPPAVSGRSEPDAAYEATKMPEPPVNVSRKEYATLDDSIRDLKNMDKDFVTTPDIFLDEFSAFLQKFQKDLQWYSEPQYRQVFAAFSAEQFQFLQEALNAVKIDADQFSESVKGVMRHEK